MFHSEKIPRRSGLRVYLVISIISRAVAVLGFYMVFPRKFRELSRVVAVRIYFGEVSQTVLVLGFYSFIPREFFPGCRGWGSG